MKIKNINITQKDLGKRIDIFLKEKCEDISRNKLSNLIKSNKVKLESKIINDPAYLIKKETQATVYIETKDNITLDNKKKELDIIFEDECIVVINKKSGVLSHLNKEKNSNNNYNVVSSLKRKKINLYNSENPSRDGIVHRLDKDTTGLMVLAKNAISYESLVRQFFERQVHKLYIALCWSVPLPLAGKIDKPISDYLNRKKARVQNIGKSAITEYIVKKNYNNTFSKVECKILTGRTHQIRVHMQSIKCPLIGDQLYSRDRNISKEYSNQLSSILNRFNRQALHAKELLFEHPKNKKKIFFSCDMPDDMVELETILSEEMLKDN